MRNLIIVVLFFITSAIGQTQSDTLQTKNDTLKTEITESKSADDSAKVDSVLEIVDTTKSSKNSDTAAVEKKVELEDSSKNIVSDSAKVKPEIDTSISMTSDSTSAHIVLDSVTEDSVSEIDTTVSEINDSSSGATVSPDTTTSVNDTASEEQLSSDTSVVEKKETADTAVVDSVIAETDGLSSDTLLVLDRGDRKYLSHVIKEKAAKKDSLYLVKEKSTESGTTQYLYQILLNGEQKWDLSITTPANDLEELFVKAAHNQSLKEGEQQARERSRGSYQVTPWEEAPSIFTEFKPAKKMLDWFAWESGAKINFYRNHLYNFNSYAGDTTQIYVDMGRPALYDLRMDLNYTHRFNFVWVGAGIERSWQNSSYFDTVHVHRGGWFSRMGWNVHVALPGFKYELFRDPGVIPFYAQYEDSLYTKLYPGAHYEYSNSLNMIVDTTYKTEQNKYFPDMIDTTVVPYKIAVMPGVGHRFSVKIGYFNYSLVIHPNAYKAPINEIGFQDMPFFKGEWDANLLILPNGRVIPHLEIDAYRTSIELGPGTLGISPFHFEVEIWGRNHFFVSLGFNAEYLTKKATFRKE